MEYCVTLNPTVDKTIELEKLETGVLNRAASVVRAAGGKAVNVAFVLKALGRDPKVVGVNSKEEGQLLRSALEEKSIFFDFHDVDGPARVNTKIVDKSTSKITEINEPGLDVSLDLLDRISDEVYRDADTGETVVLAGKLPPNAPDTYYADLTRRLQDKKVRVVVDTSGKALEEAVKARPYMIKPNLAEMCELVGKELKTVGDLQQACAEIMDKYGIEIVLVSLGTKGAFLAAREGQYYTPALAVEVNSTVGGGDSIVAGAIAYMDGTPDQMLRAGAAAAAGTLAADIPGLCTPELFSTYFGQVVIEEPQADLVITEA